MPEKELLLLEEVATLTRAGSVSTVRHWLRTGKLASVRPGRRRLVRRADLEEFLRRGARGGGIESNRDDPRQVRLPLESAGTAQGQRSPSAAKEGRAARV